MSIGAHFLGFVRADSCRGTFLSVSLSFSHAVPFSRASSVLQFLLLSLLLDPDHCRHWSRPGFMDAVPFSRQEMPRPILLRRIATAETLSRARELNWNHKLSQPGPRRCCVSSWIIGADARQHKWPPKKRTPISSFGTKEGRVSCFERNVAGAIHPRSGYIFPVSSSREAGDKMFCILMRLDYTGYIPDLICK